jgi:hypothetical protein
MRVATFVRVFLSPPTGGFYIRHAGQRWIRLIPGGLLPVIGEAVVTSGHCGHSAHRCLQPILGLAGVWTPHHVSGSGPSNELTHRPVREILGTS